MLAHSLLTAITLLALALTLTPSVQSQRTPNPVIEYSFPTPSCLTSVFQPTQHSQILDYPLTFNPTTSNLSCAKGFGVTSSNTVDPTGPRLSSVKDMSSLSPLIYSSSGLTLEFWLKFDNLGGKAVILSISSNSDYTADERRDTCAFDDAGHYDLRILQIEDHLSIDFITGTSCISVLNLSTIKLTSLEPIHIAMTMTTLPDGRGERKVYINSVLARNITTQHLAPTFSRLHRDFNLQFFSDKFMSVNPGIVDLTDTKWVDKLVPWTGSLYLFAIYGRVLSSAEVASNRDARFSENDGVNMIDGSVEIFEDGESTGGMHYNTSVEWYNLDHIPDIMSLPIVDLSVLIFGSDSLFTTTFPTSTSPSSSSSVTLELSQLPSGYKLFQVSGTPITQIGTTLDNNAVRIKPGKDVNGEDVYTIHVAAAVDNPDVTGVSDEGKVSKMNISVIAVNDPPRPYQNLTTTSLGAYTIVQLSGSDVEGDAFSAVVKDVVNGEVFQVLDNGTVDVSKMISVDGGAVTNKDLKIAYKYTAAIAITDSITTDSSIELIGTGSFRYMLRDSHDSIYVTFELNTYANTLTSPSIDSSDYSVKEDVISSIRLRGVDDIRRDLVYTIESLPEHGSLYNVNDVDLTKALKVGDTVNSNDTYSVALNAYPGVTVNYMSNKDYFNYPSQDYKGDFLNLKLDRFNYTVAVATSVNVKKSDIGVMYVRVQNTNDATQYNVPLELQVVRARGQISRVSDSVESYGNGIGSGGTSANETTDSLYFTVSNKNAITLPPDADRNVDRVAVHISTGGKGTLTLLHSKIVLTQFTDSDCDMIGRVGCTGSISTSNSVSMIFIALPNDLASIFDGLLYDSMFPDTYENITISVYDGSVPSNTRVTDVGFMFGCIPEELHSSASDRSQSSGSGCKVTTKVIKVRVLPNPIDTTTDDEVEGWFFGLTLPFYAVIIMLTSIFCCACGCCTIVTKQCRKRCSWCAAASKTNANHEDKMQKQHEQDQIDLEMAEAVIARSRPIRDLDRRESFSSRGRGRGRSSSMQGIVLGHERGGPRVSVSGNGRDVMRDVRDARDSSGDVRDDYEYSYDHEQPVYAYRAIEYQGQGSFSSPRRGSFSAESPRGMIHLRDRDVRDRDEFEMQYEQPIYAYRASESSRGSFTSPSQQRRGSFSTSTDSPLRRGSFSQSPSRPPPPAPLPKVEVRWFGHHDESGMIYYENQETGQVTWEAPRGEIIEMVEDWEE